MPRGGGDGRGRGDGVVGETCRVSGCFNLVGGLDVEGRGVRHPTRRVRGTEGRCNHSIHIISFFLSREETFDSSEKQSGRCFFASKVHVVNILQLT